MNIIVLFATNSGSTFMAAQIVNEVLIQDGHQVDLKNGIDGFYFQQDQNTQKIREWTKNLSSNFPKTT